MKLEDFSSDRPVGERYRYMIKTIFRVPLLGLSFGLMFGQIALGSGPLNVFVTGLSEGESGYSGYAQPLVGYDFTPNTTFPTGALGAYDHHFDGLERSHQIGLWERNTGVLLASAMVPGGSLAELQNGYRWVTIPSLSLQAGKTYTIASWNSGWEATGAFSISQLIVDPRISLGAGYVDTLIPDLHQPTRNGGPGIVFIGPGFASVVPEPTSGLTLLFGLFLIQRQRFTTARPPETNL